MILAISIAINPDIGHESVQNSLTELGEAALYHFLVILKTLLLECQYRERLPSRIESQCTSFHKYHINLPKYLSRNSKKCF